MENRMTAVQWLENILHDFIHPEHGAEFFPFVEQALAMEKEQHGDTWDMALKQMVERGYVWQRAMTDFDDYWAEKTNNESN